MPMVSIPAHYDGQHVRLDEEVALSPNARLIVTVLDGADGERGDFLRLAESGLAQSFEDDEVEYSEADLKR